MDRLPYKAGMVINDCFLIQEPLGKQDANFLSMMVFDLVNGYTRVLKIPSSQDEFYNLQLEQEFNLHQQYPIHSVLSRALDSGKLDNGIPFLLFDFIEGTKVNVLIQEKKLSVQETLELVKQVANGLEHLHKYGVYHQNLKPSNLLWTGKEACIIDFGEAVIEGDHKDTPSDNCFLPPDLHEAEFATIGERIDRDLYALGVTLYECLASQLSFPQELNPLSLYPVDYELLSEFLVQEESLWELLTKMLAPHQVDRFLNVTEFLVELNRTINHLNLRHLLNSSSSPENKIKSQPDVSLHQSVPMSPNPVIKVKSNKKATNLFNTISHCPIVQECLEIKSAGHLCKKIVHSQQVETLEEFQIPEPWSGNLEDAPILFLSSNPSISVTEVYPTNSWSDPEIFDYFHNRFGGGRKIWIKDGTKSLQGTGFYNKDVPYWQTIKEHAEVLFEREVKPGIDYALSEVVHCKSKGQEGVAEALSTCVKRYLTQVLELSNARVVIILGRETRNGLNQILTIPANSSIYGPVEIFGKERILVFLPNPGAGRYGRAITLQENFTFGNLAQIKTFLRQ